MTQNDVMQLLIGKTCAGSPTSADGVVITEACDTYLLDGEIVTTNAHNVVVNATTVLSDARVLQDGFKFIQRSGTELISTDLIKADNIRNYHGELDAVAAEQLTYIGYDGTAYALEVNSSKLYVTRISLREGDDTGQGQEMIINSPYKSDSTATQAEVGLGIALALSNSLRRQTVKPIKSELVNSAAHTAANLIDHDATVVNGSKNFSVANNLTYQTAGETLAVGDYVRIGTIAAGTALTDGVYKVMVITALVVTVDRPIEMPTGTYATGTADIEVIPAATAIAADFGMKLTGIARAMTVGKFRYSKVSFKVGLDSSESYGDTPVTYTTTMDLGHGTYNQIAQLEWELLGNRGSDYRADFLYSAEKADAVATSTYDTLAINFFGDHPTEGVGATPRRAKQLVVALETGFTGGSSSDLICDVLDAVTGISGGVGV